METSHQTVGITPKAFWVAAFGCYSGPDNVWDTTKRVPPVGNEGRRFVGAPNFFSKPGQKRTSNMERRTIICDRLTCGGT